MDRSSTVTLGRRAASLLGALVLAALPVSPGAAAPSDEWGTVSAADRVLREGCRTYAYRYSLTPPPGDWMFESVLVDPRGRRVASDFQTSSYDPERGFGGFRLCGTRMLTGRYTIRSLVVVDDGPETEQRRLRPEHFRFRRR